MSDIVKVIDWKPEWPGGAPMPQVYSNEHDTFLIYHTVNSTYKNEEIAIVEFLHTQAYKFGIVNDEALNGHPLYNKGLVYYKPHEIENSSWLEEIKTIHKVHPRSSEDHWKDQRHFILVFQDSILEIIARDYKIETVKSSLLTTALKIAGKINGQN